MALGVGTLKFEMLSDEELFGNWDKPVTSDQKPILEAAAAQTPTYRGPKGLYTDLMDVEKFIRLNSLQEVTNPIMLNKNMPTPDGVLSYEIFGTSQNDRRNRMAYIDLHGHYMHPLAATKLASYDRRLSRILYSQGKWKLTSSGDLEEDTSEEGQSGYDTGPEFLYSIWGKIKVKDKETITTKEIQKFFEKDRDILFLTKFPVIPAFYRDINTQSNTSTKSSAIINSMYNSLISYTQSMEMYTDFTNMARLSQAKVQNILVDIYKHLMVETVKGQPSKFGMLRRSMMGKNVNYSARLVISAPVLRKSSYQDVQVKFGYAAVPLGYTLSCFFPFMVHHLKRFFDQEFIQAGKYQVKDKDGKIISVTFTSSYDENDITSMITKFINSPSSRFDPVLTPPDTAGNRYPMVITGRFGKDNTTITNRKATLTDVMYIVAHRVVQDKHVFVTRYPLDNYNGQYPAKVEVASTTRTEPAIIGETMYPFYPICEGDPSNAFIDTLQFSNTYLGPMGGDLTYQRHGPCGSNVVRTTR